MHRRERAALGDDESLFRPADDPRKRGGCACSSDCVVQGVWPKVEPDPAEMAERYGPDTAVIDWSKRLVCSVCENHDTDMVVTGTEQR